MYWLIHQALLLVGGFANNAEAHSAILGDVSQNYSTSVQPGEGGARGSSRSKLEAMKRAAPAGEANPAGSGAPSAEMGGLGASRDALQPRTFPPEPSATTSPPRQLPHAGADGRRGPECTLRSNAQKLFIWKDPNAHAEASAIIQAEGLEKMATRAKLLRFAACIVDPGLRAEIVARTGATVNIVVREGPRAGCSGTVANNVCSTR
jgi:hypothetical protein